MVVPIVDKTDKRLRAVAAAVPASLFKSEQLAGIITDMADTLDKEPDGVALAAPQIGVSYRIFIVRYDRIAERKEGDPIPRADVGVFVNPELVKMSKKSNTVEEGCLSVRGLYGKTKRKERATVVAYDTAGAKFERGGGNLLAQAFQHEIDHLNGVLFIDHATDIVEAEVPEEPRTYTHA